MRSHSSTEVLDSLLTLVSHEASEEAFDIMMELLHVAVGFIQATAAAETGSPQQRSG